MAPLMGRNDENMPPEHALKELNQGPNDEDRMRFGFAKQRRPSQEKTGALSARAAQGLRREGSCSAILSARSSFNGAAWASQTDVEVVSLVERLLGDRESSMASLLRMRSSASKYDFKARINELSEQNRVLRAAVLEHRESSKALIDVLGPVQADINFRLRTAASDLSIARAQLRERSQLVEEVQEALRAVMREESGQAQTQISSGDAAMHMQQEIDRLKRILSMETARAERAESRVHDRDALVAGLREELEAARAEAKRHKELARESAQQAKQQVDEAAQLLSKQVKDAAENHRQMLIIAKQREESLIAELTRMAALVEVSTIAAQVRELPLPEPSLETPTEASGWSEDVSLHP